MEKAHWTGGCGEAGFRLLVNEAISQLLAHQLGEEKVEQMGYHVGHRLAESLTKDRPRFADNLEIIKFMCKEFWIELFTKQVDNLKTNHRGTFVLTDNDFRWLTHVAAGGDASAEAQRELSRYALFPCGLIRGALANLGVTAAVVVETRGALCSFTLRV